MNVSDYVVRISHNRDIIFKIIKIENSIYYLQGVYIRLLADAYEDDLELADDNLFLRDEKKNETYQKKVIEGIRRKKGFITGKILHLDGDKEYLDKSLSLYNDVGVYANGYADREENFSKVIVSLVEQYQPDIIIITGHDSYNNKGIKDLFNYVNTSNFINTLREIRKRYSKDDIFVFAGACQSNFEALIANGANFASSPKRVNIHAYDPAIVGIIASYSPFSSIIKMEDVIYHSESEDLGIGGIESYGKMRLLL